MFGCTTTKTTTLANVPAFSFEHEMRAGAVSTITFFEGKPPMEQLRERVLQIVRANPWLMGRLVKRNGGTVLEYEDDVEQIFCDVTEHWPKPASRRNSKDTMDVAGINIHRGMHCDEISTAAKTLLCKEKGGQVLSNMFTVSVVRDSEAPEDRFAIVMSMSHNIADGHTYYKIYNMLSKRVPIVAYKASRLDEESYIEAVEDAMGKQEARMHFNKGSTRDMLSMVSILTRGAFSSSRATAGFDVLEVDADQIAQRKNKNGGSVSGVQFISTNDIVTHALMDAADRDVSMMAVDMRNRIDLPGLGPSLVGNYEQIIPYRKADRTSPELIRKSVLTLRRASLCPAVGVEATKLPRGLGTSACVVTSWAGFMEEIELDQCKQTHHQPLLCGKTFTTLSFCIIFQPTKGKLAVIATKDVFSGGCGYAQESSIFVRTAPERA